MMPQKKFLDWVLDTFGPRATTVAERARRHFEEDAELMQSTGMTETMAHKIVSHVWGKPPGSAAVEMGQAQGTLYALAQALCVDSAQCAETELTRCMAKDADHHNARWDVKKRAGIAEG